MRAALALIAALAGPAMAADAPTLADLQDQLDQVGRELQSLRAEMVASGHRGFVAAGGDSAIDRMDAMQAQITRLTNQTEMLANRIAQTTAASAARMDEISFRLCEMDPACDLGALMTGQDAPARGDQMPAPLPGPATAPAPGTGGAETGTNTSASAAETALFEAAKGSLGRGQFMQAADQFGALAQAHAGGALTAHALFLRGRALEQAGHPQDAAQAWLAGFAAAPDGPFAPDALLGLARVAGQMGHDDSACLYLLELPARFPASPQAAEADALMAAQGCLASDAGGTEAEADADLTLGDG